MSLFIHRENQTLLWETLHKSPHWPSFEKNMGENIQLWFRNIISMFYDRRWETHPDLQMTIEELKQLNREFVVYCIQDIKRCLGIHISPSNVYTNEKGASAFDMSSRMAMYDRPPEGGGNTILTTPPLIHPTNTNAPTPPMPTYAQLQAEFNVSEQKEIMAKRAAAEFEAFQRQYNDNFMAPKPNSIDFTISLNEPKIKNMDELMEQQRTYREMQDKMLTPPVLGSLDPPIRVSSST